MLVYINRVELVPILDVEQSQGTISFTIMRFFFWLLSRKILFGAVKVFNNFLSAATTFLRMVIENRWCFKEIIFFLFFFVVFNFSVSAMIYHCFKIIIIIYFVHSRFGDQSKIFEFNRDLFYYIILFYTPRVNWRATITIELSSFLHFAKFVCLYRTSN